MNYYRSVIGRNEWRRISHECRRSARSQDRRPQRLPRALRKAVEIISTSHPDALFGDEYPRGTYSEYEDRLEWRMRFAEKRSERPYHLGAIFRDFGQLRIVRLP